MAITLDHIHVEDVKLKGSAKDGYATVTFRVLEEDHPNTFLVPVLVNMTQIDSSALTNHARYVFHHLMRTLSETTRHWKPWTAPASGPKASCPRYRASPYLSALSCLRYRASPYLSALVCNAGDAPLRLIDREMIYSGWGRFLLLQVELGDGRLVQRQMEDHGEAAAVLPYDAERKVALVVRQARAGPLYGGFEPHLVEAAAGMIDPGETAAATAAREALEELGVRLGGVESVVAAWSMPGVSSERIHLFLAPYCAAVRVAPGGGVADEGEEIEVLELPLPILVRQADSGILTDIKTLALVWALARRRPELF